MIATTFKYVQIHTKRTEISEQSERMKRALGREGHEDDVVSWIDAYLVY